MKIKSKLTLAVGLLFVMIAMLTVVSAVYINRLSNDSNNIIKDNYNSISYCREMLDALNNDINLSTEKERFLKNLELERTTITEAGERELVEKIEKSFNLLQTSSSQTLALKSLRKELSDVIILNMQAIQKKSMVAYETSKNSIIWISFTGAICFLIAFTLLVNLPSSIANPISELSNSIKQIANKNYSQRVYFESNNEFGDLAKSFNTMAQKLEEYTNSNLEKLLMEKKRIETLINNMSEPVIGIDENKNIIFINEEALKVSELNEVNCLGKPIQDIAVYNDLIRSLVQDLFDSKTASDKKSPLNIYADNKESFFEKEIIPIKIIPTGEDEMKLIGNVILLRNITTYKELDIAKTNFISTLSHEFKTPISSMKMSLHLLENEKIGHLNNEQRNLVNSIHEDSNRLLRITGDLLNMSQVDSGIIQMEPQSTQVAEIIQYAIQTTKQFADHKQIEILTEENHDVPFVWADKEKTTWVLINLLTNAIRYSHDNTRVVVSTNKEKDHISISITDSGQGIAPEYLSKIFDRYFRVPGINKGGTGLGLSISKEFMEAQGGSISVKSELGIGSTFMVRLIRVDKKSKE